MGQAIVIYDSDCGFCRVSSALLLTWDRLGAGRRRSASCALRPLPLGTDEADRLLAGMTEERRHASWHLIDPDGRRHSAGAALAPALSLLPGGRIPAACVSRAPHLTERGYRWVAEHRGLLGRFLPARARRWADRAIAAHGGPQ
ncbi:MAG: DCC1-like thiol-disulfide oxidoreductase family protein [Solirubrobacterales bacterium]